MNLISTITGLAGRVGFVLGKKSPTIMLVGGLLGMGGTIFLACRATLKCEETVEIAKEKFDMIEVAWEKSEAGLLRDPYTEKDKNKDKLVAYVQTGVAFIKLYGPPVLLCLVSVGLIVGGHNVLQKRNVALMAAYKAVSEAFKAYRKRVVEEHGEQADFMYKNNIRAVDITEEVDGKPVTTTVLKKGVKTDGGMYARTFNDENSEWTGTRMYNEMFLVQQQNWVNDLLHVRGHVFLNEVYDRLGFDRSTAGAVVGWVDNKDHTKKIDFGVEEFCKVYNTDGGIELDFNVDGVIYDLI